MTGQQYTPDPAFIERFRAGQPTGPGQLFKEFVTSQAKAPGNLSRFNLYETDWGFIAESKPPFLIWDFYAADVWRQGTEAFYDRFLTAWKNEAAPALEEAIERSGRSFYISFDDGISNYSCISLGCLSPREAPTARAWVADVLLKTLWPSMLAHVLDPTHKFKANWHCS